MNTQAMTVEMRPIASIKPYKGNPRLNNKAVAAVARSIQDYGFRVPIVVDAESVIIAGHTRLKAAQQLGLERVPVHVAENLTPEQVRAFRIADNATASIATWDDGLLIEELTALQGVGIDVGTLGLASEELERLLGAGIHGSVGQSDPDSVPQAPDEATTKVGDLWLLGDHRLLCGDSSKADDVQKLVNGEVMDLLIADPPYGVGVTPRSNNAIAAGLSSFGESGLQNHQRFDVARGASKAHGASQKLRPKDRPLANDFLSAEAFLEMLTACFNSAASVLKPGGSFYVWGGYANLSNYPAPLKQAGLYFSQAIVWDKEWPVLTRKDFLGSFELCFYGWKEGAAHWFNPEITNATDLWHVRKVTPQDMCHLTEKPTELAELAMTYSSRPGDKVLDLFGGSGSTLIAAEGTGRKAYLMEIDELYCDVIVRRWEEFTGRKAERVVQGA